MTGPETMECGTGGSSQKGSVDTTVSASPIMLLSHHRSFLGQQIPRPIFSAFPDGAGRLLGCTSSSFLFYLFIILDPIRAKRHLVH
jgi:hypothetical protein